MREIRYDSVGETLYTEVLDNGLTLYVLQKPDFRQTYACFTTKYGSIDNDFVVPGQSAVRHVPDGIAHFLEHKMFEEEHGDIFLDFAKNGAQTNAFTTFDSTTYLFSSTDKVLDSLSILIDFVQRPYFTDENVEKEKGIIAQEIRMYEDNPFWQVFKGLLQGMYGQHPLATDIAGTVESIYQITKEDLYDCHRTFYHPGNMVLFVIGPMEPDVILEHVVANQAAKGYQPQPPIVRGFPPVPKHPSQALRESRLAVSQPRTMFGFKETAVPVTGQLRQRHEAAMEIALDALLGRGAQLYYALIDEDLADAGFGASYELTEYYGHTMMGGNSNHPEKLAERVKSALQDAAKNGLDPTDFERTKRKAIGRFLSLMDSPQGIANVYTQQMLRGIDVLTTLDFLRVMTVQDVNQALQSHVRNDQFAVSIVRPQS
ncbi:MAG: pitrilysin family protein [Firmicutes bacterium]|nr:pitrilysin family protein [Bacillota bacterium]